MTAPITELRFAVWAPSEAVFWQSWADAGIVETVEGVLQYTSGYPGIFTSAEGGWNGHIVKTPAVLDVDGVTVLTPAVMVAGWHTNVRVTGQLVAEMTYGLGQYEADGETLKNIFDRTWAVNIFQLTYKPSDSETKYPEGYQNVNSGVVYADGTPGVSKFKSPSNIIL